MAGQALRRAGVGAALLAALWGAAWSPVQARTAADEAVIAQSSLPVEARQVDSLIRSGGPFAYAKDGAVFANREHRLPRQFRGYYREYTVRTPGASDRGARRIVCGGRDKLAPDACYYTADHYNTFKRIVQ